MLAVMPGQRPRPQQGPPSPSQTLVRSSERSTVERQRHKFARESSMLGSWPSTIASLTVLPLAQPAPRACNSLASFLGDQLPLGTADLSLAAGRLTGKKQREYNSSLLGQFIMSATKAGRQVLQMRA
jgi:hypothetical protein